MADRTAKEVIMRPHIDPIHSTEDSSRIIYLGDVRRRRSAWNRAPDRHYLATLVLIAGAGWISWLTVLLTLQPARLLTYLAFLTPLWVALAATTAIVIYAIDWRRGLPPGLVTACRRGALVASIVVANLALAAAHHWLWPVGIASLVTAIVLELVLYLR